MDLPSRHPPRHLAPVCKIAARVFKVLACRVGAEGYQIDAFGADIFILVTADEPDAHYLLVGSRDGPITLTGPGCGHVYRDGSGDGAAIRWALARQQAIYASQR